MAPATASTRVSALALLVVAVATAVSAASAAPAKHVAPASRTARDSLRGRPPSALKPASSDRPPPVELVESVPIETSLGNPKLRRAKDVWPEMIRAATASIDLEEYYLSNLPGEPLEPVLEALVEAARRGVRVRLLLDARMHDTYPQPADSLGHVPGITVRTIDMGKISGGIQHAKYFIIDAQTVYVGSQNLDWRSLEHIHELGVRVHDERLAARFQQVFEMDWAVAGLQAAGADSSGVLGSAPPQGPAGQLPIRVVQAPGDTVELRPSWCPLSFSPDSALWDRDAIVRSIDGAHSEVVAQSLHYSSADRRIRDDAIDQALRRAAARGVRIRLLISDWQAGSESMQTLDSLAAVPGIEVRLSSVPEWSRAYIPFARVDHSKYMVVDTLVTWVGTSNWEPSYFHAARNLAVTLRNRPLAGAAREVFEVGWKANADRPVRDRRVYPARLHGVTPPAGVRVYGR